MHEFPIDTGNFLTATMATTSTSEPRISVLMPAHNEAKHVCEAVDSILQQTFADFELLIIDDASSDRTPDLLQRLAQADTRIRLFHNDEPQGLPACMNRLVRMARGKYVARMDADDISAPGRFASQADVLDGGAVDLCASLYIEFPDRRIRILGNALEDEELKISLLFEYTIMHPTVMMRKELLLKEPYRTEAIPAADYDLWIRLARFARMRVLPEVLLLKRVHKNQISNRRESDQKHAAMRAQRMGLQDIGIIPSEHELHLHNRIWTAEPPATWQEVLETETWLVRLATKFAGNAAASRHLARRWYKYCLKAAPYGLRTFRLFRRSMLAGLNPYSLFDRCAVYVLSILRIAYQSRLYWIIFAMRPPSRRSQVEDRDLPPGWREKVHS